MPGGKARSPPQRSRELETKRARFEFTFFYGLRYFFNDKNFIVFSRATPLALRFRDERRPLSGTKDFCINWIMFARWP